MKNGKDIVREMMHEVILYGGLPARRCDVYDHALRTVRTHDVSEQRARWAADLYAFGFNTQLAPVGTVPLTLAELDSLP